MVNGYFLSSYLCRIFWVIEINGFRVDKFEKDVCSREKSDIANQAIVINSIIKHPDLMFTYDR